jgi:hypothetical protein
VSVNALWKTRLAFLTVVLAAAVMAACQGGSKSTNDAAAPTAAATASVAEKAGDPASTGIVTGRKACDLLTRLDSELAVGQPLPQNSMNLTLGTCDYNAADFSAGTSLTVGSWDSIKGAATGGAHQPQPISGIGDEALYFAGAEKGSGPMYVRRGNEGFLLTLNGTKIDRMPGAEAVAVQKDLALKILQRF